MGPSSVLMSFVLLLGLVHTSSLLGLRLYGRHALFPPRGEQEKRVRRDRERHSASQVSTTPAPFSPRGAAPSGDQDDLADIAPLDDHAVRCTGFLEAVFTGH